MRRLWNWRVRWGYLELVPRVHLVGILVGWFVALGAVLPQSQLHVYDMEPIPARLDRGDDGGAVQVAGGLAVLAVASGLVAWIIDRWVFPNREAAVEKASRA